MKLALPAYFSAALTVSHCSRSNHPPTRAGNLLGKYTTTGLHGQPCPVTLFPCGHYPPACCGVRLVLCAPPSSRGHVWSGIALAAVSWELTWAVFHPLFTGVLCSLFFWQGIHFMSLFFLLLILFRLQPPCSSHQFSRLDNMPFFYD